MPSKNKSVRNAKRRNLFSDYDEFRECVEHVLGKGTDGRIVDLYAFALFANKRELLQFLDSRLGTEGNIEERKAVFINFVEKTKDEC